MTNGKILKNITGFGAGCGRGLVRGALEGMVGNFVIATSARKMSESAGNTFKEARGKPDTYERIKATSSCITRYFIRSSMHIAALGYMAESLIHMDLRCIPVLAINALSVGYEIKKYRERKNSRVI